MQTAGPADVIFVNGAIATLDPALPHAEAVAVSGGRIVAVGGNAAVRRHAGPATEIVDLGGRRVVPGLIDAHCHPVETLWMKDDWVDARFPETIIGHGEQVRRQAPRAFADDRSRAPGGRRDWTR